tara:strand:+ start:252 stop:887 length:636 start_codon:yes stop_codon:yes gene_type:complete
MTQSSNTERLKILQERLAQIKEKGKVITENIDEKKAVEDIKENEETKEKQQKKSGNKKYIFIGLMILVGFFYLLPSDKIDIEFFGKVLTFDFQNNSSTGNGIFIDEKIEDKAIQSQKETYDFNAIEYKIEKLNIKGGAICLIENLQIEEDAISLTNKLKETGFKAGYFFQPEYSNNSKEMYTIFIGPYENKEEAKQWQKNIPINKEIRILE